MAALVDGQWVSEEKWADTDGEFRRKASSFRDRISVDGAFTPEAHRYHLYVSHACPWAHRTVIVRALKGLTDVIGVSVVHPLMVDDGWTFHDGDGVIPDPFGAAFLREVYIRADAHYTGRVTVPVLWDTKTKRMVSNESSEIIRDFNGPMSALSSTKEARELDLYPTALRADIDAINTRVYDTVNNGVYRAGFATSQAAYERAFNELFASLDFLDAHLSTRTFLVGETLTEADIRLFTTLVRFDAVYVGHFKCNRQRISDYVHLTKFLHRVLDVDGVRDTLHLSHIKNHYYASHKKLNPSGVVPLGPALSF